MSGLGVGHHVGQNVLLTELVDDVSVVRHRDRDFFHHLENAGLRQVDEEEMGAEQTRLCHSGLF